MFTVPKMSKQKPFFMKAACYYLTNLDFLYLSLSYSLLIILFKKYFLYLDDISLSFGKFLPPRALLSAGFRRMLKDE